MVKRGSIPFWSWNDELDVDGLKEQIKWMHDNGINGFFMHARSGLSTPYLGEKWHECIVECGKYARELGMEAWAYDENGWPSGFVGGKLLDEEENRDCALVERVGAYDEKALASFYDDGEKLVKVTSGDNVINVYMVRSTSTADILNPDVVDKFIKLTHKEYAKRDCYGLMGFFTDEPQYYRWGVPYTTVLDGYFMQKYGESVIDNLGLLFYEREGYRTFRYRYWLAMQSLMVKNFGKKIYDWCDEHGYQLTGHYIAEETLAGQMLCCGGCMPFYEFEHMPGIDWLGRRIGTMVAPKQLSSVCEQLDKKYRMTETFALAGWDVTPVELKQIADYQYVGGVNILCQHLLPFSERGSRKRDYPSHFIPLNPWIEKGGFKAFNEYYASLTETLSRSHDEVSVAMLHPMRSAYFGWKKAPTGERAAPLDEFTKLDEQFIYATNMLTYYHIPFHYADETIMERYARVEDGRLIIGKCSYDTLVLPLIYTMGKNTYELLKSFVSGGGKVLMLNGAPEFVEGEKGDYAFLRNSVTVDDILADRTVKIGYNENLRSAVKTDGSGLRYAFVCNVGKKTTMNIEGTWQATDAFSGVKRVFKDSIEVLEGQSLMIYPTDEEVDKTTDYEIIKLGERFTVVTSAENNLTIDCVSASTDGGVTYGEKMNVRKLFTKLLEDRYEGKLQLKYSFNAKVVPQTAYFTCEYDSITVNGTTLTCGQPCKFGRGFYRYDVAKYLVGGNNDIVANIDYYQSEDVYYALFGENVTESLRNCMVYSTEIESGYLSGDFAVYGEFSRGEQDDILLGENFYLGSKKQEVDCLITDGYPFFSGDVTLTQRFNASGKAAKLVIDKRFHFIEVIINGKKAGEMMLTNELDISKYVKAGENELTLVLTVSNHNLLGPFHAERQVDNHVVTQSWDELARDNYALIKTII